MFTQIVVINYDGDTVAILGSNTVENIRYSVELNGLGALAFSMPLYDAPLEILHKDYLAILYRASSTSSMRYIEGYFITKWRIIQDDDNTAWLSVGCISLNDLMNRRVIVPKDDPLGANGYTTKSGSPDVVMNEVITEQLITPATYTERGISGLSVASIAGGLPSVPLREELGKLYVFDVIKKLQKRSLLDFEIVQTSGNLLEFRPAYKGTDKRRSSNYPYTPFLYFTPDIGNIKNTELAFDSSDEKNAALIYAQGQGDDRVRLHRNSPQAETSQWSRREIFLDVTVENYVEILTEYYNVIRENQGTRKMTFDLVNDAKGAVWFDDWVIGDYVTAGWQGFEFDYRIAKVDVDLSSNEENVKVTLESELDV